MDNLTEICKDIRKTIFRHIYRQGGGHYASCLSCVEILASLYFGGILKHNPKNPKWDDRDIFILSKGHAAMALYAVLSKAGYFDESKIDSFGGHPELGIPGVEATTGSLGHGIGIAAGMAYALKLQGKSNNVYCLVGDGELQEGSCNETIRFMIENSLTNMVVIIDCNGIGALNLIPEPDLNFCCSWRPMSVDSIINELKKDSFSFNKIYTTKGKGISFMENQPLWHQRQVTVQELEIALKELGMTKEEL